jgi:hypothetical protein
MTSPLLLSPHRSTNYQRLPPQPCFQACLSTLATAYGELFFIRMVRPWERYFPMFSKIENVNKKEPYSLLSCLFPLCMFSNFHTCCVVQPFDSDPCEEVDWMFPEVEWMFLKVDWMFPKVDWMFPKVVLIFPFCVVQPFDSDPCVDVVAARGGVAQVFLNSPLWGSNSPLRGSNSPLLGPASPPFGPKAQLFCFNIRSLLCSS